MQTLLLGTRNPGKVKEIKSILVDSGWPFSSLEEFSDVEVAEENAPTYAENAIAKARFYATATGLCALADDSGLEVEALGGAPGVYSARYAGENASDTDRRTLLLSELAATHEEKLADTHEEKGREGDSSRRARFVSVVAISDASGLVLNVSEGICEGTIIHSPRGSGGFGYDPLFVPNGYNQTFAELAEEVKNRISHRAHALIKTLSFLTSCKSY